MLSKNEKMVQEKCKCENTNTHTHTISSFFPVSLSRWSPGHITPSTYHTLTRNLYADAIANIYIVSASICYNTHTRFSNEFFTRALSAFQWHAFYSHTFVYVIHSFVSTVVSRCTIRCFLICCSLVVVDFYSLLSHTFTTVCVDLLSNNDDLLCGYGLYHADLENYMHRNHCIVLDV